MKYDIDSTSISEIAEGIALDYLGTKAGDIKCIDIEGLITEYFKLKILYEKFAEDDPNKDGFIADGIKTVRVWRKGKRTDVVFQKGTVVFDSYLLRNDMSSHRRFCMAHEAAHYVFGKENIALLGTFHRSFDNEYDYSFDQLKDMFSIHEVQASNMGSALLLPRFLVERTLKQYFPRRKAIPVYGESTMFANDRQSFIDMADQLGVSKKTLLIQLKQYGMIRYYPMDDLVKQMKKKGRWGDEIQ